MRLNLLHAHGSPTLYQYQHGCRCVSCGGARSTSNAAYAACHKEEKRVQRIAYDAAHKEEQRHERVEFIEWLQILRTVNGCEDCETHEGGLEHHHVDPSNKRFNVAAMCNCSLDTLEDELEKCVVLCRFCHKQRHADMEREYL